MSQSTADIFILPHVYELGYRTGHFVQSLISNRGDLISGGIESISSLTKIWTFIKSFPFVYSEWWLNLVQNDPVHVFVETTLILSVIYMLISRNNQDWRDDRKDKLTAAEEEELLSEWKNRCRVPLGADDTYQSDEDEKDKLREEEEAYPKIVIYGMKGRTMQIKIDNEQEMRTVVNFANFDFLGMSSTDDALELPAPLQELEPEPEPQTKEEKKTPDESANSKNNTSKQSSSKDPETPIITTTGVGSSVKDAARTALGHYGCGSCGPRGFYGTIDVHLDLEKEYSEFLGVDGAILYSDGASTCSSTVAAFAKRGDLIIVDEGIYEPLIAGVKLSRAYVKWFKHNDMDDLQRVLENVRETDKKLKRKSNSQRRFIIVEGLYKNTGKIVPLDRLVQLKHEYCCRLLVDESHSFGCLGPTGKGVIELYNKRPMYDVEIITIALENSMGSIGGITVGSDEVVDHQRLSGSGYCFSASSPPFTASAAIQALKQLQSYGPNILLKQLNKNKENMNGKLDHLLNNTKCGISNQEIKLSDLFVITSDERSAIIYLMLNQQCQLLQAKQESTEQKEKQPKKKEKVIMNKNKNGKQKSTEKASGKSEQSVTKAEEIVNSTETPSGPIIPNEFIFLCRIVRECLKNGIAFVVTGKNFGNVRAEPPPAIRITISAIQTDNDIDTAISVLKQSVINVLASSENK